MLGAFKEAQDRGGAVPAEPAGSPAPNLPTDADVAFPTLALTKAEQKERDKTNKKLAKEAAKEQVGTHLVAAVGE